MPLNERPNLLKRVGISTSNHFVQEDSGIKILIDFHDDRAKIPPSS